MLKFWSRYFRKCFGSCPAKCNLKTVWMLLFFKPDILKWNEFEWKKFDVIVSNPPYIRESEKLQMHSNVLNFEPENALFVTDADPLIFYRSIAAFAKKNLTKSGMLFLKSTKTWDWK
jgi:methylase of polypeptide subunit release factors